MPNSPSSFIAVQPEGHHLAELNIATARGDMDAPIMQEFVNALDQVNAIADRSPGFVWRQQDESGNATGITYTKDPRAITNLSVWETAKDFEHYVWNTVHRRFMQKGDDWFLPRTDRYFVMWWVPIGHEPTLEEALGRLAMINADGPSHDAFDWSSLPGQRLWQTPDAPPRTS